MPATIDFTLPAPNIGGQAIPLRLYAEGALLWPATQTLFITDPHFGKADSFRHAGIAIPTNVLDQDLLKVSKLLLESGATNLVILGDFFHSRASQSSYVLDALGHWRDQHANLTISIVQGNHDAHAGPPPTELAIQTSVAPLPIPPFICHHLPQPMPCEDGYILAGHLHPYVTLRDRDGSRLRFASFIFGPHQAILPAFGGFTGGSAYAPTPNDRVFVLSQGEIAEVPTMRKRPSAPRR